MTITHHSDFTGTNGDIVSTLTPDVGHPLVPITDWQLFVRDNQAIGNAPSGQVLQQKINELDLPGDDYAIEGAFKFLNNSIVPSAEIRCRCIDDSNFVSIFKNQASVILYTTVGGTADIWQTVPAPLDDGEEYTLRIEADGATVRGFYNEVEIFSPETTTLLDKGYAVVLFYASGGDMDYTSSIRIDDLLVETLEDVDPPDDGDSSLPAIYFNI